MPARHRFRPLATLREILGRGRRAQPPAAPVPVGAMVVVGGMTGAAHRVHQGGFLRGLPRGKSLRRPVWCAGASGGPHRPGAFSLLGVRAEHLMAWYPRSISDQDTHRGTPPHPDGTVTTAWASAFARASCWRRDGPARRATRP